MLVKAGRLRSKGQQALLFKVKVQLVNCHRKNGLEIYLFYICGFKKFVRKITYLIAKWVGFQCRQCFSVDGLTGIFVEAVRLRSKVKTLCA